MARVSSPDKVKISLHRDVETGSGTHPGSCKIGTRLIRLGKATADHSPPSDVEFKYDEVITSLSLHSYGMIIN